MLRNSNVLMRHCCSKHWSFCFRFRTPNTSTGNGSLSYTIDTSRCKWSIYKQPLHMKFPSVRHTRHKFFARIHSTCKCNFAKIRCNSIWTWQRKGYTSGREDQSSRGRRMLKHCCDLTYIILPKMMSRTLLSTVS